jgi:hypothetical protein
LHDAAWQDEEGLSLQAVLALEREKERRMEFRERQVASSTGSRCLDENLENFFASPQKVTQAGRAIAKHIFEIQNQT